MADIVERLNDKQMLRRNTRAENVNDGWYAIPKEDLTFAVKARDDAADEITRLRSQLAEAREEIGHLLWLVEVEHKIDGQHITARAHTTLERIKEEPK